jgi:hypothetical protein
LEHYSLIFAGRPSTAPLMERQAALCSIVLDVYSLVGKSLRTKMDQQTWEIFLKLMIAICDSLLKPEIEVMQRKLSAQLLRVCFFFHFFIY